MEIIVVVPQKARNRFIILFTYTTPIYIPRRLYIQPQRQRQRHLLIHVHDYSQGMETT